MSKNVNLPLVTLFNRPVDVRVDFEANKKYFSI
jgi:hypothetical protein